MLRALRMPVLSAVAMATCSAELAVPLEMVKCGSFLCPADGLLPLGVLVSAYSSENHTFHRLMREAHTAGRSAKRVSPHVPTALITQETSLVERDAFDYAVPVRPDLLIRGVQREAGCALLPSTKHFEPRLDQSDSLVGR